MIELFKPLTVDELLEIVGLAKAIDALEEPRLELVPDESEDTDG